MKRIKLGVKWNAAITQETGSKEDEFNKDARMYVCKAGITENKGVHCEMKLYRIGF